MRTAILHVLLLAAALAVAATPAASANGRRLSQCELMVDCDSGAQDCQQGRNVAASSRILLM